MGGYGSGSRSTRKLTVEDCLSLDTANLLKFGMVKGSYSYISGTFSWKNSAERDDTLGELPPSGGEQHRKNSAPLLSMWQRRRGLLDRRADTPSDNSAQLRGRALVVHLPVDSQGAFGLAKIRLGKRCAKTLGANIRLSE